MRLLISVTLKKGVLDPQGLAIKNSLTSIGFDNINTVKQGKIMEINIQETDPLKAKAQAEQMCERLLANTVIEEYMIELKQ